MTVEAFRRNNKSHVTIVRYTSVGNKIRTKKINRVVCEQIFYFIKNENRDLIVKPVVLFAPFGFKSKTYARMTGVHYYHGYN